jgi:hypothetical protein
MKYPAVVYGNIYCILQRLTRLVMYSNRRRKDFPNLPHLAATELSSLAGSLYRYFVQRSRNGL